MKKTILLFLAIATCYTASAQLALQKLTDSALLEKGNALYKAKDFFGAAPYLYSYYQRNYDVVKASNSTLEKCLRFLDDENKFYKQQQRENQREASKSQPGIYSAGLESVAPDLTLPTEAAFTSYQLMLKGSELIEYSIIANHNFDHIEVVIVGFTKAPSGYDANNNLESGQATWLDRPLNADEPSVIVVPIKNEDFKITNSSGRTFFKGSLAFLNDIQTPSEKFAFQLYNNGQGFLMVTQPPVSLNAKKPKAVKKKQ